MENIPEQSKNLTDYEGPYNKSPEGVNNNNDLKKVVNKVSSQMTFNPDSLTNNPESGNSWNTVVDYMEAISYQQEEKPYFPSWGVLDLENIDLENENLEPKEALAGLLKTAAALKVQIPYTDGKSLDIETLGKSWEEIQDEIALDDNVKESVMTLEELILDIYPGLERGVEEIKEQLELAISDPKKFEEQFNISGMTIRKWLSAKVPQAATLVTLTVLLANCTLSPERTHEVEVPAITTSPSSTVMSMLEPTATPTVLPTATLEPTSTPTPEPIPTATLVPPIIIGNIEPFIEGIEENVVLSTVMELQSIVNNYNPESGTFNEYILEQKKSVEGDELLLALEELLQIKELNDVTLAQVLQKSLPELGIVEFSPWPKSMYEVLRPVFYEILSEDKSLPIRPNYRAGGIFSEEDDIYIYMGDFTGRLDLLHPGDLIVNTDTFDIHKSSGFSLLTILNVKEGLEETYVLVVTVNEEGKIELKSVPESETKGIFGEGRWLFWARLRLINGY